MGFLPVPPPPALSLGSQNEDDEHFADRKPCWLGASTAVSQRNFCKNHLCHCLLFAEEGMGWFHVMSPPFTSDTKHVWLFAYTCPTTRGIPFLFGRKVLFKGGQGDPPTSAFSMVGCIHPPVYFYIFCSCSWVGLIYLKCRWPLLLFPFESF